MSGFERFEENGPQARECVSCARLIPWKWVPEAEMRRTGGCLVPCRLRSRVSAALILRGLSVSPSMKWESRSRSAQKERGRRFEIRGLPWMPRNWSSNRSLDLLSWWSLEVGAQCGDNLTTPPTPPTPFLFKDFGSVSILGHRESHPGDENSPSAGGKPGSTPLMQPLVRTPHPPGSSGIRVQGLSEGDTVVTHTLFPGLHPRSPTSRAS